MNVKNMEDGKAEAMDEIFKVWWETNLKYETGKGRTFWCKVKSLN